jgi:exonuclease III
MDRDISPPPTKRRKLSPSKDASCRQQPSPSNDNSLLRIYSWNINGIKAFLQKEITSFFTPQNTLSTSKHEPSPAASLREFLRRHNWPQILCLQEVKIAPGDAKTQAAVKTAVNASADGPRYQVFFTLPRDKFNARTFGGKVYGVCSIIRSDFSHAYVENVRDVSWNQEGRISVIEIGTGNGEKLAIWNVYAVNGTTNEWRDSRTGEVLGTRHDCKIAVHKMIMDECKFMGEQGWKILILGDLNVAPQRIDGFPNLRTWPEQHVINRADFNRQFLDTENEEGFRGVDIWRYLRGKEKKYTYHPRTVKWGTSCDRVDLALASRTMIKSGLVAGAEIWDCDQERGPSDHVPLSVDLRLPSPHPQMTKPDTRLLILLSDI